MDFMIAGVLAEDGFKLADGRFRLALGPQRRTEIEAELEIGGRVA